ncbi:cytochrome c oxidase accessory protein CcoG [Idiomarina xiamenensis]|uniref:(Fe-S)-binding protein n=1 Tax=Idiomarina xiamenensis 10-D-4 TaxID=740709 RepID=K2JXN3_9GAMM|nr:cytochrome c oxidase accessory protein CcoG [Idiomarina xiamenensis]EKE79407.1 (Fe-S)-binding protein [Idiomarina xiamenensis 10-D-4]
MEQKVEVQPADKVKIHRPNQQHDNQYAPRSRIYVREAQGKLENFRRLFGFILLALFAVIPFITYNGEQAVLLNIAEQRFRIFGLTLWPQDFTIVAWIAIVAAFGLFFVTTLYGRVWCGFMCPQTTWTFLFMWFERFFEGSRHQRMKLDERSWDFDKLWRKAAKHGAWLLISLLTALVFVGYFTDIRLLFVDFFTFDAGFWAVFSVLFFAFCTYGNAGWMREIMCTHICPYARFQSAMFDKDTLTVSYDVDRGEPRGPRSRKVDPKEKGLGDCIDCNLCVQVCPTGIDIRNGLQYECINCGACVDACNGVMEKMNYAKGLIRYTTERSLKGGKTHFLRFKSVGYAIAMVIITALLVWDISSRVPLEMDILRDRNRLYTMNMDNWVENVYTLKIMNKGQQPATYRVTVDGVDNYQLKGNSEITVAAGEVASLPLTLAVEPSSLNGRFTDVEFTLTAIDDASVTTSHEIRFIYE